MKIILFSLLLCGTPPLIAAPSASYPRNAGRAIQAIYDRQDAAIARKDEAGVLFGDAPDYKEIHTEPTVHGMSFTVAQLRPMIHSMLFFARTASRKTVIQQIVLTPHGAAVTLRQRMVLWMPVPKQHKNGQIIINTTSADVWVKGKTGWQDKQSTVLSGQTTGYLHDWAKTRR